MLNNLSIQVILLCVIALSLVILRLYTVMLCLLFISTQSTSLYVYTTHPHDVVGAVPVELGCPLRAVRREDVVRLFIHKHINHTYQLNNNTKTKTKQTTTTTTTTTTTNNNNTSTNHTNNINSSAPAARPPWPPSASRCWSCLGRGQIYI